MPKVHRICFGRMNEEPVESPPRRVRKYDPDQPRDDSGRWVAVRVAEADRGDEGEVGHFFRSLSPSQGHQSIDTRNVREARVFGGRKAFERAYTKNPVAAVNREYDLRDLRRYWSAGGPGRSVRVDVHDSRQGENFGTVTAEINSTRAGRLSYSDYLGEVRVAMIEVAPEHRRQSVATEMLQRLADAYPDSFIRLGYKTRDGVEFAAARHVRELVGRHNSRVQERITFQREVEAHDRKQQSRSANDQLTSDEALRRMGLKKHPGGHDHDQKSHGNWAHGESSGGQSRDIETDFGFVYRGGVVDGDTLQLAALARFGETDVPGSAGYILSGGELLDLSGAREGGTPGVRSYDHRNISAAYPDSYDIPEGMGYMGHFMQETGAIRLHVASGGEVSATIDVEGPPPSNAALKRLVDLAETELYLDVWSESARDGVASATIPEPSVSLLRRVLYSAKIGESIKYAERERD